MKLWIFSVLTFLLISCTKDSLPNPQDCTDALIDELGWTPYNGQQFGCTSIYLGKYLWQNRSYFYFGGHCIDFVFNPFDCDRQALQEALSPEDWQRFLLEGRDVGIVAFQE